MVCKPTGAAGAAENRPIGAARRSLDEKIGFIRDVEPEFVCSQLSIAAARALYQECEGTRILELPHALNPKQYFPVPNMPRQVDIGFSARNVYTIC